MQQTRITSLLSRLTQYSRWCSVKAIDFGTQRGSPSSYSTMSFEEFEENNSDKDDDDDDVLSKKREMQPQGVDPRRGWNFRGVHRAIICGRIGQAPIQKILRNGRTVTIFNVGTGGMFDQRITWSENMPRPVQWHRIVVHNDTLGAYAVQKLIKDSPVFVEGDIETRVYNDSINGVVKNVAEICVRRDGKVRLIKTSEGIDTSSLDDLKSLLLGFFGVAYDAHVVGPLPVSVSWDRKGRSGRRKQLCVVGTKSPNKANGK